VHNIYVYTVVAGDDSTCILLKQSGPGPECKHHAAGTVYEGLYQHILDLCLVRLFLDDMLLSKQTYSLRNNMITEYNISHVWSDKQRGACRSREYSLQADLQSGTQQAVRTVMDHVNCSCADDSPDG